MGKNLSLEKRMKEYYENRTRYYIPRKTHAIIRIDGKAFHTYTKGLEQPYDAYLMDDMDKTAEFLCSEIQGAKLAYVQSDEISILFDDLNTIETDLWFDGNIQKIASVSASFATAKFNELQSKGFTSPHKLAFFDSRLFTIPGIVEVKNYFIWRQKDAIRNSISSAAQTYFSTEELNGVNTKQMQEKLFQEKGINWSKYPEGFKNGRIIVKETYTLKDENETERSHWVIKPADIFTKEDTIINEILGIK